ncbi:hypothetical protein [Natronoflexus pectinivorans]|uniref:hypothetical protein n=1 Tax=Natronoflexus pectinivorans TaxID=682526 RepID=UPI0010440CF3|nr:hypothetical protein [Natronoflexus pectinivorans]
MILLGVFLFVSCSDDLEVVKVSEESELSESIDLDNVMRFSSFEEYVEMRNAVPEFGAEERIAFENEHGFISMGRISDEFYDRIDDEAFETKEEFVAFINENDRYLVLKEDEDGLSVYSRFYSNADRFFANEDGYFVVDSLVFRVFENGTIYSHIKNGDELIRVCEDNLSNIVQDNDKLFYYYEALDINLLKSSSLVCTDLRARKTHSRRRVRLNVHGGNVYSFVNGLPATYFRYGIEVSSWRRSSGVWKRVNRTTYADARLIGRCAINDVQVERRYQINGVRGNRIWRVEEDLLAIGGHWNTHDIQFLAVEGWAINSSLIERSSEPARLQSCNTHLFTSITNGYSDWSN